MVIKPNNVAIDNQLCATHAGCLEGILEFLKSIGKLENTVIAESAADGPTLDGFANYHYTDLAKKYSVKLIDLNPGFGNAPVISSISVNKAGERNVVSANASRVDALPAQVDEATLEQASIVLVDGHYMEACLAWASAARARGIPVVLDGGSWKAGTDELLKHIDTAICSADFMPPGCSTSYGVVKNLFGYGVTNIAITNGAEPIQFVSGESAGTVEVPQVQLVGTMGAGDILHGAFCYYASTGDEFVDALRKAAKVASESCRFHGTREWMKHATEY